MSVTISSIFEFLWGFSIWFMAVNLEKIVNVTVHGNYHYSLCSVLCIHSFLPHSPCFHLTVWCPEGVKVWAVSQKL